MLSPTSRDSDSNGLRWGTCINFPKSFWGESHTHRRESYWFIARSNYLMTWAYSKKMLKPKATWSQAGREGVFCSRQTWARLWSDVLSRRCCAEAIDGSLPEWDLFLVITREILKLRWILLVSSSFLLAPVCSALWIHHLRFETALGHIRKRLKGMGEQVQVAFPDIQPNFKSRRRMHTSCISSHQGRAPGLNLCSLFQTVTTTALPRQNW